jgi:hypothetical protein
MSNEERKAMRDLADTVAGLARALANYAIPWKEPFSQAVKVSETMSRLLTEHPTTGGT